MQLEMPLDQRTDQVINEIAHYASQYQINSPEALHTARLCLADALGCAILALKFKECTKLLGPVVPGTIVPNGCRIPGTDYILDPILGAFNLGTMIRWLDYNDAWLAAEWGHPSDNIGGILALGDYLSRKNSMEKKPPILMSDILQAIVKAYEIQGILALNNSFNKVGFDHVILVKVATAAIAAALLGCNEQQVANAVSNAWLDAGPLRAYRHAPNTGSRKSWAAGDATSRGVFFASLAAKGEMGYATALTAKKWGLQDVLFDGKPLELERPFGSYVMENILFKVSYPAEFHAQTAVEAAVQLHNEVKERLDDIRLIEIGTHQSAMRIIDKTGPLNNPADRDHCLQYMVAIGLLKGDLQAEDYEEETSKDPRIDLLRNKMKVYEVEDFSRDYLAPDKRSIANRLTILLKDGTVLGPVTVEYPLGHKFRREEATPFLMAKCEKNLLTHFSKERVITMLRLFGDHSKLEDFPVYAFVDLFYSA